MDRVAAVLCCPDKFRGTLTAAEAASALADGAGDAGFERTIELPLADGGEGTLDALLAARGGERREDWVTGPDGTPVRATWGLLPGGLAVVEMARASGLALIAVGANDAVAATTRGTGELIARASEAGATSVLLGVGGSATTDGGLGAIEALGWELPLPVTVACDVDTPFIDAARVFAPQKGAAPDEVELLRHRLLALAASLRRRTGIDVTAVPGAGAAGGLAGGLAALGATLRPGFDVVAEAASLERLLDGVSFVLTGEGRLDATSLSGKVVGGVLRAAGARALPVGVIAGAVSEDVVPLLPAGVGVASLVEVGGSVEAALADAGSLARRAAALLARVRVG